MRVTSTRLRTLSARRIRDDFGFRGIVLTEREYDHTYGRHLSERIALSYKELSRLVALCKKGRI